MGWVGPRRLKRSSPRRPPTLHVPPPPARANGARPPPAIERPAAAGLPLGAAGRGRRRCRETPQHEEARGSVSQKNKIKITAGSGPTAGLKAPGIARAWAYCPRGPQVGVGGEGCGTQSPQGSVSFTGTVTSQGGQPLMQHQQQY